jgi:tetratricopeptide (TPR) repeat protein
LKLSCSMILGTLAAGVLSCAQGGSLGARPRTADSLSVVDGRLQEAAALYNEGSYARVIDLLQPSGGMILSPKANYYIGSSFAALNDPQNAIRYLRMAVDSSQGETACRFQLARSLNAFGATGDARVQYRLILAKDSAFLPALFNLGTLCFDGRDFAGAADLFTKAVRLNPRDYLSFYNLGASLVNLGKSDSAMQFLRAGLALNVRYVPCLSLLASLYYKRKEYQDAERLYGMIVARDSLNADFWARRGYCMEKLGDPARAVICFRNASKLDTSNSTYFARLGQAYFESKEFDSAAVSYLRAASLEEDNPILYLNAGLAYARMDSLDPALGAFHSSYRASHTERLGFLYSQIAGAYYKQKRFRPAEQAYANALVYDPLNKRAIFFLAHSLDEIREPGRAAAAYGRFLKAARGDPSQADIVPYAKKRLRELSGGR